MSCNIKAYLHSCRHKIYMIDSEKSMNHVVIYTAWSKHVSIVFLFFYVERVTKTPEKEQYTKQMTFTQQYPSFIRQPLFVALRKIFLCVDTWWTLNTRKYFKHINKQRSMKKEKKKETVVNNSNFSQLNSSKNLSYTCPCLKIEFKEWNTRWKYVLYVTNYLTVSCARVISKFFYEYVQLYL